MAQYTMTFKDIFTKQEFNDVMSNYSIFDESYREHLNKKIKDVLKFYDIGFETPEMFIDRLEAWFEENMDEYNFLYESNTIKINPLLRVELMDTFNRKKNTKTQGNTQSITDFNEQIEQDKTNIETQEGNGTTTEDGTTTNNNKNTTKSNNSSITKNKEDNLNQDLHSEFPQGNLGDIGNIESFEYWSAGDRSIEKKSGESGTEGQDNSESVDEGSSKVDNTVINTSKMDANKTENIRNNRINSGNENVDATSNQDEEEGYQLKKQGFTNRTDAEMLMEYRKIFINIDKMLITAMKKDLFCLLLNLE